MSPEQLILSVDGGRNRREARKRVLLDGKIVYSDGAASLDCTILDVSPSGACIRTPRGREIPSCLHLIDVRNRMAYEATVAWYKSPLAGLRFVESYPIGSALPEHLGYLRKLWIDCAMR